MDGREWSSPTVAFVIVGRLDFSEGFLDEQLGGVCDVVGVVHYGVVDVVPVPSFAVESVDFVSDSTGFEAPLVQVLRTTRLDG